MARAICDDDPNPLLFEQAVVIAENELLLGHVTAERARIEQLRNPMAMPLAKKGDWTSDGGHQEPTREACL
jgi:hypothetical protein